MNIKGLVVAAAMMGSAAAALGCNMPSLDTANIAGDASDLATQVADSATPETAANWFSWRVWFGGPRVAVAKPVARTYYRHTYVKYAPPAPRYERVAVAPSSKVFFVKGHWTYTGRKFVWVPGHYEAKRAGYRYVDGHWNKVNGHWFYQKGHWARI
jgi:hypothetical protein